MTVLRLLLMMMVLVPAGALAQGDAPDPEPTEEPEAEPSPEAEPVPEGSEVLDDGSEPSAPDLLTQKMLSTVEAYYTGVGQEPTQQELDSGVESIRLLLLDGVSLARISTAADEAVRLHTPGRRVPFEVAVPLRIRPGVPDGEPPLSAPGLETPAPLTESENPDELPEVTPLSPEEEARLLAERQERSAKRARIRLYRQWQERTKNRRSFMAAGVASFASGYGIGFAHAGALVLNGAVPHYSAWVTAIPVVGNITLAVWTGAQYPIAIVCAIAEWAGVAMIIAGLAHKVDWPYERDPTAMRNGKKKPRGWIAFTPTGVQGRF
ncbi:MAG: hypothetical protein GY898_09195 [Proteobacteria bacterium]|nr:hypothetical protein [Pseudomonadota bacterium]